MKINILILLACLLSVPLAAQFSVGLKGGFTRAWEDYGDASVPEDAIIHVNGFHLSGLAYYQLADRLAIGLEPGFVKRGAACFPGFIDFQGDTKWLLDYIELPGLIAYQQPIISNRFTLISKLGFGISRITTAYQEITDLRTDDPPVRTKITDDTRVINRWDHGFYGSLGLSYFIGHNQVFLSADYYHCLKDVDRLQASQNRGLNLAMGYLIQLSGS
jgi:hypothetical protein